MKHFLLICLLAGSLLSLGMTGGTLETVVVPNVEGVSLELAAQILRNAGLEPQGQSAALSALVTRQAPRPGFEVQTGSVVALFVDGQSQILQSGSNAGSPSSTITSQNSRAIVQSPQAAASAQTVGPLSMWGTQVTVTPQDPAVAAFQGQSQIQAGTRQEIGPTLMYEPLQAPVTPYFAQSQTQRFYPVWYPRQFIPESASSTPQTSIPAGSTGNVTILYYPAVDAGSDGVSSIQSSTRVGLIQTSTSPAVSVPNVARLPQQDAIAALTKAGLWAGVATLVDSAEVRSGYVVQQSPQPRQLVPAGTQVQLWIAR